ncbi:hypothetical protein A3A38_00240 [Candidatus Kaiserbacteria bacterium RIFCSPLOWO2_01_FULL_53_17]|uniref:C-methyltransferase domain-containing protein n=1 Tax=Candidatus Kaiserbacteria bacterium RIFCSPLOWO2_01_FULL_53_17 TaxID=1798511 RepID=A0A1F6EG87_9BACT|nr:MAG: hypothetical protein A3A38_00240 [Candidatus Kaiserbacteria bacterium RIFCSPLOWO2_01_FULL_53_17]
MKRLQTYIDRQKSVVTGKQNLEHLYTFKDFPVFFGCVDTPIEDDLVADMGWYIDPESGVIQLTKLVPLEILYQSQHMDGTGAVWKKHNEAFRDFILAENVRNVLEIGGAHGVLADLVTAQSKNVHWTIVEPNPLHAGNERISIIKAFFDEHFSYDKPVDTIVFAHTLEHAYDPFLFLKACAKFLPEGNRLIFAYPNLESWLRQKFTNAINFEHTMLLTDVHLDHLLPKAGFKIIKKHVYEDHSFFYVAERDNSVVVPSIPNTYSAYKAIFQDFISYHENLIKNLNAKIAAATEPVYLFGAHIFSTYLIAFGLNTRKIISILDNSPIKQKKRLYATDFIVESPKILAGKGKVNLILKAGVHTESIKKDIIENIDPDVVFW